MRRAKYIYSFTRNSQATLWISYVGYCWALNIFLHLGDKIKSRDRTACRNVNTAPLLASNGRYAYTLQIKGIFEVSLCPTTGIVVYPVCLYLRCRLAAGASRLSVKTSLLIRVTNTYIFKDLKKSEDSDVIVEYRNTPPKGANCFLKWLTMAVKWASNFGTINAYDTAMDVVLHFFFFARFASQMQYTWRRHVWLFGYGCSLTVRLSC